MDNMQERKELQSKSERVIALGEEFQPFDPKYATPNIIYHDKPSIQLKIDDNLKIPIRISAYICHAQKINSITPFEPELGYIIDSEDLNLESRLVKIRRLDKELRQDIDFGKAPLNLSIGSGGSMLNELGLNREGLLYGYEFSQEMLDLFKRLRILIFFPESRFEARPKLDRGEISFQDYYPIDARPLPIPETYSTLDPREGFSLLLPSDPEKLAQIRARFVMVEEPEEIQA